MKKHICFLYITIFLLSLASPLKAAAAYNMEMEFRMDYLTGQGTLYYDSTANKGGAIKYSTIGFRMYFYSTTVKNGSSFMRYTIDLPLVSSWCYQEIDNGDNTMTWKYKIPFQYVQDPADINQNTILSKFLLKYWSNLAYVEDIKDFFGSANTLTLDYIFTITENGKPSGGFTSSGSPWGEVYYTLESIRAAQNWRQSTYDGFVQYYGKKFTFTPVMLQPPTPKISKQSNTPSSVITAASYPTFTEDDSIVLYSDQSVFPSRAFQKFYQWEYKLAETSYPAPDPKLKGTGIKPIAFPKLAAGTYKVRLSVWYATNDGREHQELIKTTEITMYVQPSAKDARVDITPTVDKDKVISQAQIDANELIRVRVDGLAALKNYTETGNVTKWIINLRLDPNEGDTQYQRFTFTTLSGLIPGTGETITTVSSLGLTQAAGKDFYIPAGVLISQSSYTQRFAIKAAITISGKEIESPLVYCSVTLLKQGSPPPPDPDNQPPVAVLKAPSAVMAGELFTLDGKDSYDPDGTIVAYRMWIEEGLTWSVTEPESYMVFPMGRESYVVYLEVTDNKGATGITSRTITVLLPTPFPFINESGKLKENRIVNIEVNCPFDSPGYPVDYAKTTWTVEPIDGSGATEEIYIVTVASSVASEVKGDPYSAAALNGKRSMKLLFRKAGEYNVTVKVINSAGISGTAQRRIKIVEDAAPAGRVEYENNVLRETKINGVYHAVLTVLDSTYSPDGDFIQQRHIYAVYDANNNGSYTDLEDVVIEIDSSNDPIYIENNKTFTKAVKDVGKYLIVIEVKEGFAP